MITWEYIFGQFSVIELVIFTTVMYVILFFLGERDLKDAVSLIPGLAIGYFIAKIIHSLIILLPDILRELRSLIF
jgi:hypothetical protein|tara:strand:- start:33 stop:257 length:225 start_codon:yes stop_codon:yes gene_type:complete